MQILKIFVQRAQIRPGKNASTYMEDKKNLTGKLLSSLRSEYNKLNERKKTLYLYTLLFLLVFYAAFSVFLAGNRTFICIFDGRETYFQSYIATGIWVRQIISNFLHGDFTVPLYSFSSGWGVRGLGTGLDPLDLLITPFFDKAYGEALYLIIIVLKLYLAGLSFLYLCHYFKKDRISSLTGCFVYLFSGYMVYAGLAFPSYITPMIQFPLLITGAERVMRKEKSIGFVFTVMYTAMCGYYHLYIQTIMIGLYCIVRLFALYPGWERLKALPGRLASGIGKWLLGLGLSGFILLPATLGFGSAARSEFRNISISSSFATHWRVFWQRLMSLIAPVRNYDWDWGLDYPAFAAIFLLCAVVIFTAGRKQKFTQKWLLVIGLFMLFCPWCGIVMNGFQYPCNRWSFGLALFAGFLVTDTLPDLFKLSGLQKKACLTAVIAYGCIGLFSASIRKEVFASVGTAFLAFTLLLISLLSDVPEKTAKLRKPLCLVLVCLNVTANSLFLCSLESMGWSKWFTPAKQEERRIMNAVEGEPVLSPYGYKTGNGRIDSTDLYYYNSSVYGQPATNIYSPLLTGNIVEFRDKTESCGNIQYFKIFSSDQRTILNSLLSVDQQYELPPYTQYVPYGYKYLGESPLGYQVYQNEYSLGWGYTYDHSVSYDQVSGLNGIGMQEVMLRSVVLDKDKQIAPGSIETEHVRLPYNFNCRGCTWKNGVIKTGNSGGQIDLEADLKKGTEYYIRIKGFNIDGYGNDSFTISTSSSIDIYVKSGSVTKTARAMAPSYPWYYGRENYLFCLGCLDEDRSTIQFQIPAAGTFKLEAIELYALPMDHYPEQAEKLRQEKLQNVFLGTNEFSGTIDITGNKVLCITVPYEDGWTAYVDGKETEILRANYAFMGLNLSEGHHEIVLKFQVPYLTKGIIVSLVSLCLTLTLFVILKKKKAKDS